MFCFLFLKDHTTKKYWWWRRRQEVTVSRVAHEDGFFHERCFLLKSWLLPWSQSGSGREINDKDPVMEHVVPGKDAEPLSPRQKHSFPSTCHRCFLPLPENLLETQIHWVIIGSLWKFQYWHIIVRINIYVIMFIY